MFTWENVNWQLLIRRGTFSLLICSSHGKDCLCLLDGNIANSAHVTGNTTLAYKQTLTHPVSGSGWLEAHGVKHGHAETKQKKNTIIMQSDCEKRSASMNTLVSDSALLLWLPWLCWIPRWQRSPLLLWLRERSLHTCSILFILLSNCTML